MLKPLTLSLGVALAFGITSAAMAHGNDPNCATCGLASAQGLASPQGVVASPQGYAPTVCNECGACDECNTGCSRLGNLRNRFGAMRSRLNELMHPPVTYEWVLKKKRLWGHRNGCDGGCDGGCGPVESVFPTSQVIPSGQAHAAPQSYAAPQAAPQGYAAPQAAPVYGAGQHTFMSKPVPTVALGAEEAPPAPEVKTGGLLLPTPEAE